MAQNRNKAVYDVSAGVRAIKALTAQEIALRDVLRANETLRQQEEQQRENQRRSDIEALNNARSVAELATLVRRLIGDGAVSE